MPQIGPLEILVVSVLALIVFGPQKLPELARSAGKGIRQLKGMAQDFRSEFDMGLDRDEAKDGSVRPSTDPSRPPADGATDAAVEETVHARSGAS